MNKNEFVEKNYKLIASACKKYHNMCSGYIEFEDFYNNCCLIFLTRKSFDSVINTKPSPFIYKVVFMEALTTIRTYQSQKRKISKENLMSLDYIYNNENSKKGDFRENSIVKTYDDVSAPIANEIIELINKRLTEKQLLQFKYMLQGLTPKETEKITGENVRSINKKRVMVRRKAKDVIDKYYK